MRLSALFYASFTVGGILLFDYAHGQSAPAPEADTSIRVTAPAATFRSLRLAEVAAVRGTYAMSNGWLLTVRPGARSMLARIDDRPPVTLRAISADRFVALDGTMSMEFNMGDSGSDMMLVYKPDALAAAVVVRASLASR